MDYFACHEELGIKTELQLLWYESARVPLDLITKKRLHFTKALIDKVVLLTSLANHIQYRLDVSTPMIQTP